MAQTYDFENQLTRYPSTLKANNDLGLALAEDITYEVESYDAGDDTTAYRQKTSVRDVLEELDEKISNSSASGKAENIIYKEATDSTAEVTVKDALDNIGDIDNAVKTILSSAVAALAYSSLAQQAYLSSLLFVSLLSLVKTNALSEIDNRTTDIQNRLDNVDNLIVAINELANIFNASLFPQDGSTNSTFAIVSENEYLQLNEDGDLNENTVYFCYDPASIDLPDNAYSVLLNVNDYTLGAVTGSGAYEAGSDVVVKAYPAPGCLFAGWKTTASGSYISTNATYTITSINSNTTLYAEFLADATKYNVYISSSNYEAGSVRFSGLSQDVYNTVINEGTSVTLVADDPATGYIFKCWKINGQETENTSTVLQHTPSGDTLYIAVYQLNNTININITILPEGSGNVGGAGQALKGQTVVLYAEPNEGYGFAGWEYDNGQSTDDNPLILENRLLDLNVQANFNVI